MRRALGRTFEELVEKDRKFGERYGVPGEQIAAMLAGQPREEAAEILKSARIVYTEASGGVFLRLVKREIRSLVMSANWRRLHLRPAPDMRRAVLLELCADHAKCRETHPEFQGGEK